PATARLPIAVSTDRPAISISRARATLTLTTRLDAAIGSAQAIAAVAADDGAAVAAGDPRHEHPAGGGLDPESAHRAHRFDGQRVAFDEDRRRRAAVHAPRAALDERVRAARANLRGEAGAGLGARVPRRGRSDPCDAPERLLGDVHSRAVAGREKDDV